MSENIIKFPSKAKQRDNMKARLNVAIDSMDKYYEAIDDIMQEMCRLEDEVAKIEKDYSLILREYAKKIAADELETHYLAYCTEANVHWDGDTNRIIFQLPLEDENVSIEEEEE